MNGDELYAWQEKDSSGWGLIAGYIPQIGVSAPLVARKLEVAQRMAPVARRHAEDTGNPIRLGKFEFREEVIVVCQG